jgi:hypothetical protein
MRPLTPEHLLVQARFSRLDRTAPSDCWTWTGTKALRGSTYYGQHVWQGKKNYIHRWFYERLVGPIPEGYEIDHLCFNTLCCNPAHLEAVTPRVNRQRSRKAVEQAQRTHCPQGHPYEGHNLIVRRGKRECRACTYERNAAARKRRRASKAWA